MPYGKELQHKIEEEYKRLYYDKYGKRNPATLSSWELDQIMTQAARNVNKGRRGV
jgi:hypothetical protein